jgi:hypothetical protein
MLGSYRPTYFAHPSRALHQGVCIGARLCLPSGRIPGKATEGGLLQTDRGTNMKSVATRPGEAVILTDWCKLGGVASIPKNISPFNSQDHDRVLCLFLTRANKCIAHRLE